MKTQLNPLEESSEKRRLEEEIAKKERLLSELIEQIENLKIDLSIVKQEYEIKIGRLYLRLDEVELEILKLKKIGDLISKGIPFDEARRLVEESLKDRTEHIREEYQKLNEEEADLKSKKAVSEDEKVELTKLYRKLARRFHPDLANGNAEMMKKINKAYTDGDLETLRAIDQSEPSKEMGPKTIEALRTKVAKLEKSIQKMQDEFGKLRESEWFLMKENIDLAKKRGRNFLGELSLKIMSDIAEKEAKLKEQKDQYE